MGSSSERTLMLKKITLLRERVEDWTTYPFCVPAIASLPEISIHSRIAFFAGENGTRKSTLLEAIAAHYGFGPEGGNRNFSSDTTEKNRSTDPLAKALRLSFDKRTGAGFFLRAESFFNTASAIDNLGVQDGYGGRSLHAQSHGESFFSLLLHKFTRNGLFLLDEPEAALNASSPSSSSSTTPSAATKTPSSSSPPTPPSSSATPAHRSSPSTTATFTRSTTKTPLRSRLFAASPTTATTSWKNSSRRRPPCSKNPTSRSS
jgi:predicted ATPase